MEYNCNTSIEMILLISFIVLMLFLLALVYLLNVLIPFLKDRKYIKMEMERSDGEEYEHWKKELKKLYRYHMPLIGRFFR